MIKKFYFNPQLSQFDKVIRGINISYDEETILIHTSNTLAYYKFEPLTRPIEENLNERSQKDPYLVDTSTNENL